MPQQCPRNKKEDKLAKTWLPVDAKEYGTEFIFKSQNIYKELEWHIYRDSGIF